MARQALGMVEAEGLCPAICACDAMLKAANVRIIEIERAKGGGYTTVKVEGDVAAVEAACRAGVAYITEMGKMVSVKVIPRPAKSTADWFMKEEYDRKCLYRREIFV